MCITINSRWLKNWYRRSKIVLEGLGNKKIDPFIKEENGIKEREEIMEI